MKRFLLAAVGLITAISFAPAIADARSCCYGYRVKYYRVHPHYKVVRPAPRPARWALGLRLTAMSTDQMIADEAVVLGGLGGHLRYRGYRWGVELAVDGVGAEFVGGKIQRVSVPIQGSALLYLIPEGVSTSTSWAACALSRPSSAGITPTFKTSSTSPSSASTVGWALISISDAALP